MSPAVAALLVAAAAAGTGLLLGLSLLARRPEKLQSVLQPYLEGEAVPESTATGLAATLPSLQRAAEALDEMAERRQFRSKLADRLDRAGLRIGVGEFLVFCALGVAAGLVLGALLGHFLGAVVGVLLTGMTPAVVVEVKARRRSAAFAAQLPELLKLLATSLRAGFSLMQALDAVVDQLADPAAGELRRALAAARLGQPVDEALTEVAGRMGNRDFSWTVMAVGIQREVGGNLSEILDTVAETMLERQRLRREVRALTAEGRLSAYILIALPIGLGIFITMANPQYMHTMFSSRGGHFMLAGGVLLDIVGTFWLIRSVKVEV